MFGFWLLSPAWASETVYDLDPAHTQAMFSIDRFGFTSIFGVFAKSGGTVWLDENRPERSRVSAWVTTDSLWSADPERDGYLRGKDWLNSTANPTLTFKSTRVVPTGASAANVTGDLTVFGQTRSVTFLVKLNKIGTDIVTRRRAAGFTLDGAISRKQFGNQTADSLIGDMVQIRIEALAEQRL
jgi:polyisoprenoid-binding protein YceI